MEITSLFEDDLTAFIGHQKWDKKWSVSHLIKLQNLDSPEIALLKAIKTKENGFIRNEISILISRKEEIL